MGEAGRNRDGAAMHVRRVWLSTVDMKGLGRGSANRVLRGLVRSRSPVHRLPLCAQLGAEEVFDDFH